MATIPHLNLLGTDSIVTLGISVDSMMNKSLWNDMKETVHQVSNYVEHDMTLQSADEQMCQNFPDVFKPEHGCVKDFELDIRIKNDTRPIFCKPRPVPVALQNELAQAYEAGFKKAVLKITQFNDYGTPVVPVRKINYQVKKVLVFGSVGTTQSLLTHSWRLTDNHFLYLKN